MLTSIRHDIAKILVRNIALTEQQIVQLFEFPKQLEHGHLALPLFALAKIRRQAPPLLAKELAQLPELTQLAGVSQVTPVGGYLNFVLQDTFLQCALVSGTKPNVKDIGFSQQGAGKTVVIDYGSPNMAKPMSIGHLRASIIGQAIRNLSTTQGYKVIGINHIGDWGVQFGKLAWAFQHWGKEYPFAEKPFQSLLELYVRFHDMAEKDPELEAQGSKTFVKLEQGDPEIKKIWQLFLDISLKEFQRLWDILGIRHELVRGESFYNSRVGAVESQLEKVGLLQESQGATVVMLEDEKMPPCLIRKSDGATLYATRDLASAIYRFEELKADWNLYVVGADQTLHFQQVFKVLEKMGFSWAQKCRHIAFGLYRFKDVKMSTRKGNVILLEDVLFKAIEFAEKIIEAKNPDLKDKKKIAQQVGVGALMFHDLQYDRIKDVDFDWDKILDFEGDTGPYVQYCQVRCQSVLEKYGKAVPDGFATALSAPEERELIRLLVNYPQILSNAFELFKPNVVAQYLLDVCRAFNHFYHTHRILDPDSKQESSRIYLVYATQRILQAGLQVLNIDCPKAM